MFVLYSFETHRSEEYLEQKDAAKQTASRLSDKVRFFFCYSVVFTLKLINRLALSEGLRY